MQLLINRILNMFTYISAIFQERSQDVIAALLTPAAVGLALSSVQANLYALQAGQLFVYFFISFSLWGVIASCIAKGFIYPKLVKQRERVFIISHTRFFGLHLMEAVLINAPACFMAVACIAVISEWSNVLFGFILLCLVFTCSIAIGIIIAYLSFVFRNLAVIQSIVMRGGLFLTPVIWIPLDDGVSKKMILDINPISLPYELLSKLIFEKSYNSSLVPLVILLLGAACIAWFFGFRNARNIIRPEVGVSLRSVTIDIPADELHNTLLFDSEVSSDNLRVIEDQTISLKGIAVVSLPSQDLRTLISKILSGARKPTFGYCNNNCIGLASSFPMLLKPTLSIEDNIHYLQLLLGEKHFNFMRVIEAINGYPALDKRKNIPIINLPESLKDIAHKLPIIGLKGTVVFDGYFWLQDTENCQFLEEKFKIFFENTESTIFVVKQEVDKNKLFYGDIINNQYAIANKKIVDRNNVG
ncbi:MAG: hypothetical protein GY746_06230 [Gammaproteobacteria bacterium]|nr:hypothetical protein [Gammaproteobacteria bacterium]